MTEKERILDLIRKLPETVDVDDVIEKLYFKKIVDGGLADLAAGRLISHTEAKRRLAKWLQE